MNEDLMILNLMWDDNNIIVKSDNIGTNVKKYLNEKTMSNWSNNFMNSAKCLDNIKYKSEFGFDIIHQCNHLI